MLREKLRKVVNLFANMSVIEDFWLAQDQQAYIKSMRSQCRHPLGLRLVLTRQNIETQADVAHSWQRERAAVTGTRVGFVGSRRTRNQKYPPDPMWPPENPKFNLNVGSNVLCWAPIRLNPGITGYRIFGRPKWRQSAPFSWQREEKARKKAGQG